MTTRYAHILGVLLALPMACCDELSDEKEDHWAGAHYEVHDAEGKRVNVWAHPACMGLGPCVDADKRLNPPCMRVEYIGTTYLNRHYELETGDMDPCYPDHDSWIDVPYVSLFFDNECTLIAVPTNAVTKVGGILYYTSPDDILPHQTEYFRIAPNGECQGGTPATHTAFSTPGDVPIEMRTHMQNAPYEMVVSYN